MRQVVAGRLGHPGERTLACFKPALDNRIVSTLSLIRAVRTAYGEEEGYSKKSVWTIVAAG